MHCPASSPPSSPGLLQRRMASHIEKRSWMVAKEDGKPLREKLKVSKVSVPGARFAAKQIKARCSQPPSSCDLPPGLPERESQPKTQCSYWRCITPNVLQRLGIKQGAFAPSNAPSNHIVSSHCCCACSYCEPPLHGCAACLVWLAQ